MIAILMLALHDTHKPHKAKECSMILNSSFFFDVKDPVILSFLPTTSDQRRMCQRFCQQPAPRRDDRLGC